MKETFNELMASLKVAVMAILTTLGTWIAAIVEWLPADIAKIGIIPAATLSCILCYTHYKRLKIDTREKDIQYEMDLLQLEIARERRREQLENAAKRRTTD